MVPRRWPRTDGAGIDGSLQAAQKKNHNSQTIKKTKVETAADEGEAAVDSDRGVEEVKATGRDAETTLGVLPAVVDRKADATGRAGEENQAQQTGGVGDPRTVQGGGHTELMTTRGGALTDHQGGGVRPDNLNLEENTELNRD